MVPVVILVQSAGFVVRADEYVKRPQQRCDNYLGNKSPGESKY